jgi:acyl carrier protein
MAKASGLSISSVQRIRHAFGLQPHRLETFKLSTDPNFVTKVGDVVGLYVPPPERAIDAAGPAVPDEPRLQAPWRHLLGAESIDLHEVIMSLEEKFGITIDARDAQSFVTVGDAIAFVKGEVGGF